jgi:hypothetical protein
MVNFKLEELSQEFVRGRKKVADPQTIATATKWYRSFTGGRGNVGTDEILELYKMLEKSEELKQKVVDKQDVLL